MKAAKLISPRRHEIVDVTIPTIDEFEVLIEVIICGLCASELPKWRSGVLEGFEYMGHEVVGIVKEKGKYADNVEIGDRVTGYIVNGFAEYAKAHYSLVTKVPDSLQDIEAMGEPLGCLMSGARETQVILGDEAAVIGLGYMGLGFLQMLKLKGASKITAIDIREEVLETALKMGATDVMNSNDVTDDLKVTEYGVNMNGGYNVVAEVSGTQAGLTLAGQMTGVHKTLSIVGFHQNGMREVDMALWNWKAIKVVNAHERRDDFMMDCIKRGLKLVEHKRLNMGMLVTHEYDFEDIDKGFIEFDAKVKGYIKGYIRIKKDS